MLSKNIIKLRLVPLLLSFVIACTSGLGVGLLYSGYSALNALSTSTDTSTYVKVDELWNSNTKTINESSASELIGYLSSDGTMDGVQASTPQTATDIRGYTYGGKSTGQSVVVRLGGLDWIVTYISTSISGDKIATLWLSNNVQDAFVGRAQDEGEMYGYVTTSVGTGLYSDWSYDYWNADVGEYPTNMYSTSYVSVVTLNNGGRYVTSDTNLSNTYIKNSSSAFADFTIDNTTYSGDYDALTDYIVTPNQVSWQTGRQDSINELGFSNYINNESLTLGGNYSGYDYSSFEFYSDWGSDYLWLPSLTETGYSDTYVGLWALNTEERKNYDGINDTAVSGSVPGSSSNTGSGTATYSAFWSRSVSADDSYNVVSISTSGIGYGVGGFVDASGAIRPALHLNLSALSSATAAPASVGITNTIHDDNIEPLNYDVTILDSTGATVYSYAFQLTTETQSTCTLIEGRTYKIVVQAPAGYSTSIQLGEQYYYTKVLSFVATDNMNINVNTRLRSQGWFDDVTIY